MKRGQADAVGGALDHAPDSRDSRARGLAPRTAVVELAIDKGRGRRGQLGPLGPIVEALAHWTFGLETRARSGSRRGGRPRRDVAKSARYLEALRHVELRAAGLDGSLALLELERSLAATLLHWSRAMMDCKRPPSRAGQARGGFELLSARVPQMATRTIDTPRRPTTSTPPRKPPPPQFAPFPLVWCSCRPRTGVAAPARRRSPSLFGSSAPVVPGARPRRRGPKRDPASPASARGGGAGPRAASRRRSRAAAGRRDESFFLEQLIRRTFDPRLVDAVTGRPTWLTQLLHSDRGRGVLFSLAEKHPDCLLITVAIEHASTWHGLAEGEPAQKRRLRRGAGLAVNGWPPEPATSIGEQTTRARAPATEGTRCASSTAVTPSCPGGLRVPGCSR